MGLQDILASSLPLYIASTCKSDQLNLFRCSTIMEYVPCTVPNSSLTKDYKLTWWSFYRNWADITDITLREALSRSLKTLTSSIYEIDEIVSTKVTATKNGTSTPPFPHRGTRYDARPCPFVLFHGKHAASQMHLAMHWIPNNQPLASAPSDLFIVASQRSRKIWCFKKQCLSRRQALRVYMVNQALTRKKADDVKNKFISSHQQI